MDIEIFSSDGEEVENDYDNDLETLINDYDEYDFSEHRLFDNLYRQIDDV